MLLPLLFLELDDLPVVEPEDVLPVVDFDESDFAFVDEPLDVEPDILLVSFDCDDELVPEDVALEPELEPDDDDGLLLLLLPIDVFDDDGVLEDPLEIFDDWLEL